MELSFKNTKKFHLPTFMSKVSQLFRINGTTLDDLNDIIVQYISETGYIEVDQTLFFSISEQPFYSCLESSITSLNNKVEIVSFEERDEIGYQVFTVAAKKIRFVNLKIDQLLWISLVSVVEFLDISNTQCNLTSGTLDRLFSLTRLVELIAQCQSNIACTVVSKSIKILRLNHNYAKCTDIDSLSFFPELEILELASTDMTNFAFSGPFSSLKELVLDRNHMLDVKLNKNQYSQLEICSLAGCGLKQAPCIKVKQMNLSENKKIILNTLDISRLEMLNIEHCLSVDLTCLKAENSILREVLFFNTKLSQQSIQVLANLHCLQQLNISNMKLVKLPTFPKESKLRTLNLSGNEFNDDQGLRSALQLKDLEEIDLTKCYLEGLPDFYTQYSKIKVLKVENNVLEQQAATLIMRLQHLEQIDFSRFKITQPIRFVSSSLIFVDLSKKKVDNETIQLILDQQKNLKELRLEKCGITRIDISRSSLTILIVNDNDLDYCDFNSDNLIHLHAANCQLTDIPVIGPNVTIIDLSFNNFSHAMSLHKVFENVSLVNLQLHGCDIEHIEIRNFDSPVTKLDLGGNKFKNFRDVTHVFSLRKLEQLNLKQSSEEIDFIGTIGGLALKSLQVGWQTPFPLNCLAKMPVLSDVDAFSWNSAHYQEARDLMDDHRAGSKIVTQQLEAGKNRLLFVDKCMKCKNMVQNNIKKQGAIVHIQKRQVEKILAFVGTLELDGRQ